jgi:hypothetical protein
MVTTQPKSDKPESDNNMRNLIFSLSSADKTLKSLDLPLLLQKQQIRTTPTNRRPTTTPITAATIFMSSLTTLTGGDEGGGEGVDEGADDGVVVESGLTGIVGPGVVVTGFAAK